MDKIFTPKRYELKEIGNLIKDKPAKERAEIKAKELAKTDLQDGSFSLNGYDVQVIEQGTKGSLLWVKLTASKDGQPVNVGDGIFEYRNPPIMVHDGSYHKQLNRFGIEDDVPNYVEDPQMALKSIIVETIRVLNKGNI